MSTSTVSHIPAVTSPELIEAMRANRESDRARLQLLADALVLAGAPSGMLAEVIERAASLGALSERFDLIEQGMLIADGEDAFDVCWYGVDAVLAYGVDPPTQVGDTRLEADLAFLENFARTSVDYAATGELPENMTGDPGLVEANTIRNSGRFF